MAKSLSIHEIYLKYYQNIPDDIFMQIVEADNVSSSIERGKLGRYAKWLLRIYSKNKIKTAHLEQLKQYELFSVFDRVTKANIIENKDINRFNSLRDLYLAVHPYLNTKIISKNDYVRYVKQSAENLYEDDYFKVIYPKTKEASQMYGKHTKWCTAATENRYHTDFYVDYSQQGKLYIIIDKKTDKKYQMHFESNTFCDDRDIVMTVNSMGAIKKLKATQGLIDFFINERQNDVLRNESSSTINIAEQGYGDDRGVYISIYRKKYGLLHGRGNKQRILLPFEYDILRKSEIPHIMEASKNDNTELLFFSNNQLFYETVSFSNSKCIESKFELRFYENHLFAMQIQMGKADFFKMFAKARKQFKRKSRSKTPNCIVANTLTIAMIEYLYQMPEKMMIIPSQLEQICIQTIAKYKKHAIPKILGQLQFDELNMYLIIDNTMKNGIFRMRYSTFFDIIKRKLEIEKNN